jgi:hypothetical protein
MLTLIKIEITLFVITAAVILICYMASNGCDPSREKGRQQMLQHLGRYAIFFTMVLFVVILVTAIWTFV